MYVVLLLAAMAVLAGVVVIAMGRGGEIAEFRRDLPEVRFRLRTPSDVASLRLPLALLGYQERATRDALVSAAHLLTDRDAEVARLRAELAAARQDAASPARSPAGAAGGAGEAPALLLAGQDLAGQADAAAGAAASESGEPAPRS